MQQGGQSLEHWLATQSDVEIADGTTLAVLRSDIAESWQRSLMCGLRPDASPSQVPLSDVDRDSRLLQAAKPVLDQLAGGLTGTRFSILLADRDAAIVDRRFSDPKMELALDGIGAVLGSRFTEELTGTNSIATVHEVRRGMAVNGSEHFMMAMKRFSCYGEPILHPVTQHLEAVLEITGPSEDTNPLWCPIIARAARDIESQLLAGSRRAEQRMLDAYQTACWRKHHPVLVLSDDIVLSNPAAVDMLDVVDYAFLRDLVDDTPAEGSRQHRLTLAAGDEVIVKFERIPSAPSGVLIEVVPGQTRRFAVARPQERPPSWSTRLASELASYRKTRTNVAIAGEPGSGRTTACRELAGDEPVGRFDATDLDQVDQQEWLVRLGDALEGGGLVVVENVHLLSPGMTERVSRLLESTDGWFALTSGPLSDLEASHASIVARVVARVELPPLRFRRDELPMLVKSMAKSLAPNGSISVDASAWGVLINQAWAGNLTELAALVGYLVENRPNREVTAGNLPVAYRGSRKARRLSQLEQAEYDTIVRALRGCNGNKVRAARELGIGRTTLYARIRALGILA